VSDETDKPAAPAEAVPPSEGGPAAPADAHEREGLAAADVPAVVPAEPAVAPPVEPLPPVEAAASVAGVEPPAEGALESAMAESPPADASPFAEAAPSPEAPAPAVAAAPRRTPRWRRHAVGGALAITYLAVLLSTAQDIGFARDEGFYFTAADRYQQWFDLLLKDRAKAMSKDVVVKHWDMNAEHPPLMKVLFGLSHRLFNQKLGWLAPSTSYRLPGMLCGALLVYFVFLFAAKRFGELEAFLAAAFLALMPSFFYHAHLDAFDVAITLLCFLTLYAFEKSRTSSGWAVATGVLFGFALLTKLNAFFLAPTLFGVWVLRDVLRPTPATILGLLAVAAGLVLKLDMVFVGAFALLLLYAIVRASDRRPGYLGIVRFPTALVWMALLGPVILFLGWPWMWYDTVEHFRGYVNFHAKHEYYNIAYFGQNYFKPPFPLSYPFGMTALTMPVITLVAGAVGMALFLRYRFRAMHAGLAERAASPELALPGWRNAVVRLCLRPWRGARPAGAPDDEIAAAQERSPGIGMFLAINMLVPVLIIAHPKVFIFGGNKHWMPAWPFLALFAGIGAAWGLRRLAAAIPERFATPGPGRRALPLRGLAIGAGALLLLAPATQGTAQSHPFGLSHYNLLAGGVPGAADLGMCRQFWGFTTGSLLPWLNANVPRNGTVYFHDTAWDSFRMFQTDGTLRQDIRWAGSADAAMVSLVHHELHMAETEHAIWQAYGEAAPAHVLTHEGVSIISVYVRPGTKLGYVEEKGPRPGIRGPGGGKGSGVGP
jgi:hypothetical protein